MPRWSLAPAALALVLVAACTGDRGGTADTGAEKPNILLIVTDDQAWSQFTPQLMPAVFREIVDRGVLFDRAYVNSPLCCPSRASILTGLYQHHHGVLLNETPLERPTIVQALNEVGYRTMLSGKYLNSWPCEPRPEFDRWVCVGEGRSSYTEVNPMVNTDGEWDQRSGFSSEILADEAVDFVEEGGPWFLLYAPTAPHFPGDDPRYASLPVPLHRPSSYDEDTSDKPRYGNGPPMSEAEKAHIDSIWLNVTRTARALDDSIARLLAAIPDETYVIFLSDNGYLFGEHGRSGKEAPYEESIRVPFAVRFPEATPGETSQALVMNVDIAPTIAEIAGLPWSSDGLSLLPLVRRAVPALRSAALISYCGGQLSLCPEGLHYLGTAYLGFDEVPPAWWAIVTDRWKYVEYATGQEELYHRLSDPNEMTNLADDPGRASLKARLAGELDSLRAAPPH
jgi:N-acetylglucosamine-6-sulfatase